MVALNYDLLSPEQPLQIRKFNNVSTNLVNFYQPAHIGLYTICHFSQITFLTERTLFTSAIVLI